MRAICEKYGLPYNTGTFLQQTLSTWKRIFKLSLPTRGAGRTRLEPVTEEVPLRMAA